MPGMSATLMKQYIEFVADHLLTMMHYPAIYRAENPVSHVQVIVHAALMMFFCPVSLHGNDISRGEIKFLRETGGRVPNGMDKAL